MAIDTTTPTAPAAVVAGAAAMLGSLTEMLWAARPAEELLATVESLEALRSLTAGVTARALAEIDARQVAKAHTGWGSTGEWYGHLAGLRRGVGKHTVHRATALVADRADTLAALEAGLVSPEQAAVVLDAVDGLPGSPVVRGEGERAMLRAAARLDATDLAKVGRHLAAVVDPDGQDRRDEAALAREERAAHARRGFTIRPDGAGGVRVSGRGSVEDAAAITAALLPLSKPQPSPDGDEVDPEAVEADPRDHPARMWDALVGLAQHALDCGRVLPDAHSTPARVAVHLPFGRLADWATHSAPTDPAAATNLTDATAPDMTDPAGDLGDLADLGDFGMPTTDDGWEVSVATVRRWACDAEVLPVVLGGAGEVLDVGRRQRAVTPGIWHALVARDRHCAFPSCTRPPVMCQAHHIWHWADGGPTALDNLVLLCGHHHRTVHHTPWEVGINTADGKPDFWPPPRHTGGATTPIGTRTPIRHHRPRRE